MSNHFWFWGKRFGSWDNKPGDIRIQVPWGPKFTVKQMTTGREHKGEKKPTLHPNSPKAIQSRIDKELFIKNGRPSIIVRWE